ncbi:MAG: NAD-dependent protein deacetylase [Polyangiaceae bacterium]
MLDPLAGSESARVSPGSERGSDAIAELRERLAAGGAFVLTGAGVSTDSGIPDYRDDGGAWKVRAPVQYRDFVGSDATRRRYWARSMLGYPFMARTLPNAAHHALSALETRGNLSLLVTQNVDGLHRRAGSRKLIDLHGRLDQVRCLGCGALTERAVLQSELEARNPEFLPASGSAVMKPDGDAELHDVDYQRFDVVPCATCGGMLKPHVVFFGENVPAERVIPSMAALEGSRLLLIIGTSLMVFSGFRFARAAARFGVPIAIINRGITRADELSTLKLRGKVGEILSDLVSSRHGL